MRSLFLSVLILTAFSCKDPPTSSPQNEAIAAPVKGSGNTTVQLGQESIQLILDRESGRVVRATDLRVLALGIRAEGLGGVHLAAGDINGDGFDEVFVSAESGENRLLQWDNGQFKGITSTAGFPSDFLSTFASEFVDYDNDGDQDLYVAQSPSFAKVYAACEKAGGPTTSCTSRKLLGDFPNRLFRNNGGQFTEVLNAAGADDPGASLAIAFADLDGNGWQDLYVANDYGPDHVYRNVHGTFQDVTTAVGVTGGGGMGVAIADFDHNEWPDIYVTRYGRDVLWFNEGGRFKDGSSEWRVLDYSSGTIGWQSILIDANRDGLTDLAIARGHWDPTKTESFGTGGSILINHRDHFEETFQSQAGSWGVLQTGPEELMFLHPTSAPTRVPIPLR